MKIIGDKQFIFQEGQPFQSSHASTVAVLPDGDLLAAWFAGQHEKASDVAIWLARQSDNGAWSVPCKVADEEGIAHWNPVLYAQNDSLMLFYKVGHEITDWHTRFIQSVDGGYTWTASRELVSGDIGGRGRFGTNLFSWRMEQYWLLHRLNDWTLRYQASRSGSHLSISLQITGNMDEECACADGSVHLCWV